MISVIVCSVRPERLASVSKNIADTIGVPYELVSIDNRAAQLGICAAYNRGADQARFDILCFVHEDVEFIDRGWGARVLTHFENDPFLGLVGLAGSRYKACVPSGWFNDSPDDICLNVWHPSGTGTKQMLQRPKQFECETTIPVVALDGVWLCARRSVWHQIQFNEELTGFHFYDVDFSLRVAEKHSVAVVYDVALLHYSYGSFNAAWVLAALEYVNHSLRKLPAFVAPPNSVDEKERVAVRYWLRFLRKKGLPLRLRLRWLSASRCWAYPSEWRLALRFLICSGSGRQ